MLWLPEKFLKRNMKSVLNKINLQKWEFESLPGIDISVFALKLPFLQIILICNGILVIIVVE